MQHGREAFSLPTSVVCSGTTRRGLSTLCLLSAVLVLTSMPLGAAMETPESWSLSLPDSTLELKGWQETPERGDTLSYYSIYRDGQALIENRQTSYDLRLRFDPRDPLLDTAREIPEHLAPGADNELYVVQFVTQPLAEFRAQLEARGVAIVRYVPWHAYIVRAPGDVADALMDLDVVRWVGAYAPAYRVETFVREQLDDPSQVGRLTYSVLLSDATAETRSRVAARIEALGGQVDRVKDGKNQQRVTLDGHQLLEVLRFNDVLWVDRWSELQSDMDVVRRVSGADPIESFLGYSGQGVRGEVFDSGFNETHGDFANTPLLRHTSIGVGSHGASTSGIIFGDGSGDPDGRGLIPDGQGIIGDYTVIGLDDPDRYDYMGELVGAPWEAVFQSCSAGSNRTDEYTNASALLDDILFDFDLVGCQSQSNAGSQQSRPQAWAKNMISVGGVRHQNTTTPSDDNWGSGASIGPAEDGRVKPDLTHYYDSVLAPTCCGQTSYTQFSGTSAATPIVCGHVGLFFQMWSEGVWGNDTDPGATVFENRSHMTTAKAALVNGAYQYNWLNGGPNDDLDRNKQGWGLPTMRNIYLRRASTYVVDETDVLANLDSTDHVLTVAAGQASLKATMVYADPAAVPGVNLHRINDVSLQVISPSGVEYWGNNGLGAGLWSVAGGQEDFRNTVENVYVQSPEAGAWTIRVMASSIVEDGHVETPAMDVDYALWVTGVEP